ncbi:MAG: excinuclease ABC subunit UvrA [Candidatus Omnitrophica bacterium]|nr:excinuclease ABC subunit UvrA [Candidatus Omnitrophota bacterium]MBU1127502.1 excinuclease ABC subunit UvrA [Candidatus Omnitrophota bacterium]MBU1785126.1 excinuclease ABC subunit UvrA [Candidatus Omnitrophota bacterium]MBU1851519.1 excinuclease ABC subunit UvrA [Candidatus Omnitrophota bacterium]
MKKDVIYIRGAKEHNLKNIDVKIPRNALTVVTGLSGSGKSSLAFDTIYAEGQRRYVESLSSYARQFLEQLQKPRVEHIEGLSPTISIEQRTSGKNPRSTVGTQTEIYDYLRVLFARVGVQHCPKCGREISGQSSQQMVDRILSFPANTKLMILAPVIKGRKGEHIEVMRDIRKNGLIRIRLDGEIVDIGDSLPDLDKKIKHTIEAVVDRLVIRGGIRSRLSDSVETALRLGSGVIIAAVPGDGKTPDKDTLFSEHNACTACGISFEKLAPRNFSFNTPYGACPTCNGLGNKQEIDPELVVPDKSESVLRAVRPWKKGGKGLILHYRRQIRRMARYNDIDCEVPFETLTDAEQRMFLYGDGQSGFEGVIPNLERRFHRTDSDYIKEMIGGFMSMQPCPDCKGGRLRPESLSVFVGGKNINEISAVSISDAGKYFRSLKLGEMEQKIAEEILKEINARLDFLKNVGLDYLTLDRKSNTLSGGEDQRIRLATQIGAGLVGVLYVLDEPSIGLHQKDNNKLLDTLKALRDLGNTLIVVEHDEATIRMADYILDLGPGAGEHGGEVVASGTLEDILASERSITGKYLRGDIVIDIPDARRSARPGKYLEVIGAREHNLKDIDVKIPLGVFNCVTGVSGSGKSTLIDDILYRALAKKLYRAKEKPGMHKRINGARHIDKVIVIDQSPIGRTPRSNPATYTGAFSHIRKLFSSLPESRLRGYMPGRFSFNVKGGRCEACGGDGMKKIEMHFLPDVYVKCQVCGGKRFNDQTLEVRYKGWNISEVLEMSVEEALKVFENIPPIRSKLQTLLDVGLTYIRLGQQATTLSGGEAQRVKLASELSKRATGKTLYMLDEPTTGLHFADIHKLLDVLHRLVSTGNTVLVIEHNLDVIRSSDHVIDLGPEGGDEGGGVVASGTPEEIAASRRSYTGQYLKKVLPRR